MTDQLPYIPSSPPRAACVVVFNGHGQVLAVTIPKSCPSLETTWGLPGGKVESHETVEDCARRECFEETGYLIAGLVPLYTAMNCGSLCTCFVGYVTAASPDAPRGAPGEGDPAWIHVSGLLRGKYAKFNARVCQDLGVYA